MVQSAEGNILVERERTFRLNEELGSFTKTVCIGDKAVTGLPKLLLSLILGI